MKGARRGRSWFWLGAREEGTRRLFLFTALGEFKSHDAAVAAYRSRPRSGFEHDARVVEQWHVYAAGSRQPYGIGESIRTLLGTAEGK